MKTFAPKHHAFFVFSALILSGGISQAEPPSPSSDSVKSPSPAPVSKVTAVPIKNYWDANAWDPIGGSLFWHASKDATRRPSSPLKGRNVRQNPEVASGKAAKSRG